MTRRRFTPAGHKPRISAVYEKNRSARLGEPVFCVLRILWINDVINVFGKEECVQGTHQGFFARSIPARRRHGLLRRPHSAIKKRHAFACLFFMAEWVGFEPSGRSTRPHDFQKHHMKNRCIIGAYRPIIRRISALFAYISSAY